MQHINDPFRTFQFPVNRTGIYRNEREGKYEFWFCMKDKHAKCGECKFDLPREVKQAWAVNTAQQLQAMFNEMIEDGVISIAPAVAVGNN